MTHSEVAEKALEKANDAYMKAAIALTKIAEHEKTCKVQWDELQRRASQNAKLQLLVLGTMLSILGVLAYDKIMVVGG